MSAIIRRLLHTESKWNPKVMAGRVAIKILPERALNLFKKHYYAYLISHRPETWMEGDAAICAKLIGPTDNVLDIGANLGSFALFMAKRAGQVFAFEPIPQTYEFLSHNMRKMKLKNVACMKCALSDSNRMEVMVVPTYKWGSESWYDAQVKTSTSKPGLREIVVQTRTLDSLSLPLVSFVKCDAEHHELAVLRGATKTLRRNHPALMIEIASDPGDPTKPAFEVFQLLRDEGYSTYWYDGKELRAHRPGERSQNYFFLMPEHVRRVKSLNHASLEPAAVPCPSRSPIPAQPGEGGTDTCRILT